MITIRFKNGGIIKMEQDKIGNDRRAVCNAKIATNLNGKRFVKAYRSGEPLVGELSNDDIKVKGSLK